MVRQTMINGVNTREKNAILFEMKRFNFEASLIPTQYQNRHGILIQWSENGSKMSASFYNYDAYRAWWMRKIVHERRHEYKPFWDLLDKPTDQSP